MDFSLHKICSQTDGRKIVTSKDPFLNKRSGSENITYDKMYYFMISGKFCGDKFPPIITSSGRSLWLRFSSDKTISYTGFKAVYTFIQNPMGDLPDIGKCTFETGGFQGSVHVLILSDCVSYAQILSFLPFFSKHTSYFIVRK